MPIGRRNRNAGDAPAKPFGGCQVPPGLNLARSQTQHERNVATQLVSTPDKVVIAFGQSTLPASGRRTPAESPMESSSLTAPDRESGRASADGFRRRSMRRVVNRWPSTPFDEDNVADYLKMVLIAAGAPTRKGRASMNRFGRLLGTTRCGRRSAGSRCVGGRVRDHPLGQRRVQRVHAR
jgi:hypothetical protein